MIAVDMSLQFALTGTIRSGTRRLSDPSKS